MAKFKGIKKKLLPPVKGFEKISSLNTKIIQKAVPKSQQSRALRGASILEKSNLIKTSAYGIRGGAGADNSVDRRAALRAYHFNTFMPGHNTTKNLRTSEDMLASEDPEVRARGQALKDDADAETKKHGRFGLAAAAVVVGGAGGSAISSGLKATAPGKPHAPLDEDGYAYEPDYSSGARTGRTGAGRGTTRQPSKLIDILFRLFVPAKRTANVPG